MCVCVCMCVCACVCVCICKKVPDFLATSAHWTIARFRVCRQQRGVIGRVSNKHIHDLVGVASSCGKK